MTRPPRRLYGLRIFDVFRLRQYIWRGENWNLNFFFFCATKQPWQGVSFLGSIANLPLTLHDYLKPPEHSVWKRSDTETRDTSGVSIFPPSTISRYSQPGIFLPIKIWICKPVLGLKQQRCFWNLWYFWRLRLQRYCYQHHLVLQRQNNRIKPIWWCLRGFNLASTCFTRYREFHEKEERGIKKTSNE